MYDISFGAYVSTHYRNSRAQKDVAQADDQNRSLGLLRIVYTVLGPFASISNAPLIMMKTSERPGHNYKISTNNSVLQLRA